MKILILSTKLPYPPIDGGAIATLVLAEGLADAGAKVLFLAINTKKHFFPIQEIPDVLKNKIRFRAETKDTSPRFVPAFVNLVFSRRPYLSERFRSRAFTTQLIHLLEQEDIDIVQTEGPYLEHLIPVIRKYSKARISLRAHNIEHEIWERRTIHTKNPLKRSYFKLLAKRIRRLEKAMVGQSDLLVAISERDRARLIKFNPGAGSITIPAGMDLGKYPVAGPGAASEPCFIGALDWAPNEEGLRWYINMVIPCLQKELPGTVLHVAGRNAPPDLEKLLNSSEGIRYYGEVEDALTFMHEFNILVVPLLTGSGIRIKILEGMACGMSVITSTVGAEGIDVETGRHLLIANHPEEFALNIKQIIRDNSLRQRLGREARGLVKEKFDTFTIASELLSFYKRSL